MPDIPRCPAAIRLMLGCRLPLDEGEIAILVAYRDEVAADLERIDRRIAQAERDLEYESAQREAVRCLRDPSWVLLPEMLR